MPRKSRYRLRYTFWLNHHDPDEVAVADTIEILKNERSFTSTVRDGIMLANDLRQGRVEVLLKLFPWVVDALRPFVQESGKDTDDLKRELVALREAVMAREGGGYGTPPPKRLAATDDAPELVLQKKSGTDAAANFLASLAALGQ
jgi:hypothetical protein